MKRSNREMQIRKTCQLYAYVLEMLGKEVPDEIEECSVSYDFPVDCVKELYQTLEALDSDTFDKIVNNTQLQVSRDLSQWWEMYQLYIPLK